MEVLELAPALCSAAAEQAIRSRAARTSDLRPGTIVPIWRIDRAGQVLSIVSPAIDGVLLSDLLAGLHAGTVMVSDAVLFELAASIIAAVATLHQLPGAFAHGTICPAHVAVVPGGVLLTDPAMATVLQDLQCNREQLWRHYGLAFPPSASLPRFDQRTDVTQLGAVILAILLRRPLGADEYPRCARDLVLDATAAQPSYGSTLGMWIQQALQLHPRSVFATAADAGRAFTDMMAMVSGRRTAAQALDRLARDLIPCRASCGAPASLSSSR